MTKWKKAAPCGGVLFHRGFKGNTLKVYFSERLDEQENLTDTHSFYGGYAECDDLMEKPVGFKHNKLVEIYRECVEEIGDEFETFVSEREFVRKAQFVCDLMVRTSPDDNDIVDAMFVSFYVDDKLADFLENKAKPTEEQMPAKLYDISFDPNEPEHALDVTLFGLSAPYDGHELVDAIKIPSGLNVVHKHELNALAVFLYNRHYANIDFDILSK